MFVRPGFGDWLSLLSLGHCLLFPVCIAILLRHQRNPATAVAWLMTVIFIPYIGALLFVVFGVNRVRRRRRLRRRQDATSRALATLDTDRHRNPLDPDLSQLGSIPRRITELTHRLTAIRCTSGNSVEVIAESKNAFQAIEDAIRRAKHVIAVQYYIYRPDTVGTRIRDLLIERAQHGVKVRFLYDGIGSWALNKRFLKPMVEAGIHVAPFQAGRHFVDRWSINLRNHRKIVIVDDAVAFTGGLNIGDEYLGKNPRWGYWRDTHLRLRGPIVQQLLQVFQEDWYYSVGEHFEPLQIEMDPDNMPGQVLAQLIADGPHLHLRPLQMVQLSAILDAEESVTISTGYFVPPEALQQALCTAAARGVRVRILVAGPSTYWYTLWSGRSYYLSLLRAGAEIYEYMGGLFHAKVLTIDHCWSLVGTPNFDFRSLELNFEVAVAFYSRTIARQLDEQFEEDLKKSVRIDLEEWRNRPLLRVMGENFCRLFAPLL